MITSDADRTLVCGARHGSYDVTTSADRFVHPTLITIIKHLESIRPTIGYKNIPHTIYGRRYLSRYRFNYFYFSYFIPSL